MTEHIKIKSYSNYKTTINKSDQTVDIGIHVEDDDTYNINFTFKWDQIIELADKIKSLKEGI
jgi:hypothetical protein